MLHPLLRRASNLPARFGAITFGLALLAGCGDDAGDAEPTPGTGAGTGTDTSADTATDAGGDLAGGDTAPDAPPAVCTSGIDEDGDGVCDRLTADWSASAMIPEGGDRGDIYGLGAALPSVASRGLQHASSWPVDVSGILLPWPPLQTLLDPNATDATALSMQRLARNALGFGTTDEMFDWLGLARWDGDPEAWPGVAWPEGMTVGQSLGFGTVQRPEGEAMTFSCATCHTAELFGRTVVGLTNRRAQANEFFHLAGEFFPTLTPAFFQQMTGADEGEVQLFARTQESFGSVATRLPQVRGLDTSLAQVSLSLARRAEDEFATRDPEVQRSPRPNLLSRFVADSKPAVWWTLKYKTRWLSDGSIVSGNPVFTNFLWNEIGRGTDLHELEQWLKDNQRIVDELTVAVFAVEPPRWVDWFGVESIDEAAARRGHALYEDTCASCHGSYEMVWDRPDAASLTAYERLAPERLNYHRQTPVLDVGTDMQRAQGMEAFAERLNELAISQWMGTVVEVQDGYVPPPLDGIWARYPYLHNQSVPTLCEMLLPAELRTPSFWMGPSEDAETDFDADCVGYPLGDAVPASWTEDERALHDTTREGLSNAGHDDWLRDEDGSPRFDEAQRADLITFLKTL